MIFCKYAHCQIQKKLNHGYEKSGISLPLFIQKNTEDLSRNSGDGDGEGGVFWQVENGDPVTMNSCRGNETEKTVSKFLMIWWLDGGSEISALKHTNEQLDFHPFLFFSFPLLSNLFSGILRRNKGKIANLPINIFPDSFNWNHGNFHHHDLIVPFVIGLANVHVGQKHGFGNGGLAILPWRSGRCVFVWNFVVCEICTDGCQCGIVCANFDACKYTSSFRKFPPFHLGFPKIQHRQSIQISGYCFPNRRIELGWNSGTLISWIGFVHFLDNNGFRSYSKQNTKSATQRSRMRKGEGRRGGTHGTRFFQYFLIIL